MTFTWAARAARRGATTRRGATRRGAATLAVVTGLGLAGSGCRYDLEHLREGRAPSTRTLARLEPGTTTLAEALAIAGAPDGLSWRPDADVLVYDLVEQLRSRWELENPATFVAQISPQVIAAEAVTFAVYAASRSGPSSIRRRRAPAPSTTPSFSSRPLTLEGDTAGREQVLLVFDRSTQVLRAVEVARGRPAADVGGVARGTFLR